MGICQSSENLEQHITQSETQMAEKTEHLEHPQKIQKMSVSVEPPIADQNNIIQKDKKDKKEKKEKKEKKDKKSQQTNEPTNDALFDEIKLLNKKVKVLQDECSTVQLMNDNLENELIDSREQVFKEQQKKVEETYKLYAAQDEINKIEAEKTELNNKLMEIEVINAQKEEIERNKMYSITDILFKVKGDSVSKLKYNKMSKKYVVFINKINHLFYYDEAGNSKSDQKVVKIRDVLTSNYSIEKEVNKPWFLIIGEKRSVLFVSESDLMRDKWVDFIKESIKLTNLNTNLNTNLSTNASINDLSLNISQNTNDLSINISQNTNEESRSNTNTNTNTNNLSINLSENRSKLIYTKFGLAQSPINIVTSPKNSNTKIISDTEFESNPLKFNYPKIQNCTIFNNEHTVQINIENTKCTLTIRDKTYTLKQIDFRTPSEHTIDSKKFEMEMHLIHKNEQNEIAVLGFMFSTENNNRKLQREKLIFNTLKSMDESDEESDDMETDDESIDVQNNFLAQFWDQLPSQTTDDGIPLRNPISFDYLFEKSSNKFIKDAKTNEININMEIFEYIGSLTTPPFTEGVQWLISKKTHFIDYKQLEELSSCWGNENNARPVQRYFGRTVSLRSKASLQIIT